jgi:DNA polymerase I
MLVIDSFGFIYRAAGVSVKKPQNEYLYESFDTTFMQLFFKMVLPIYRAYKQEKICFVWEGTEKTYRNQIFEDYKSNSSHDLKERVKGTFDYLKDGIKHLGCYVLEQKDAEGDDMVYGVCNAFPNEPITVISGDKDFIQLLQQFNNVKLFNPMKQEYIEKPDYDFVKYLAIMGDNADSIPGLTGYGPKKSRNVLNNYKVFYDALNEESKNIIERNIKIIDLSLNPNKDKIRDYIRNTIENNKPQFDFKNLREFMRSHKLVDIFANLKTEVGFFY